MLLLLIVFWCVIYSVMGLIILAIVPGLRVTLLNLIALVIGALIGSMIFSSLYVYLQLRAPFDNHPNAAYSFGAIAGGALLLWLRIRFVKSLRDWQFP
jgi:uncharacterized membrane protein YeaQ/YmgE (transglycosylase-associated protein family)